MCFSETQSYLHAIILIIGSIFVYPETRLYLPLIFLALKDLIQGLSYRNIRKNKSTQFLTALSWIHICFQPLFVNVFASYFDKNFKYWNIIFLICLFYGLYNITKLKEFDIQNDPNCVKINKFNDFCSKKTQSYIGKYHIGYKFKRDSDKIFFPITYYLILTFLPSLFTKARNFGITWILFVGLIYSIFNNVGHGEKAAIWCYSSIIIFLPFALFNKQVSKINFPFFPRN